MRSLRGQLQSVFPRGFLPIAQARRRPKSNGSHEIKTPTALPQTLVPSFVPRTGPEMFGITVCGKSNPKTLLRVARLTCPIASHLANSSFVRSECQRLKHSPAVRKLQSKETSEHDRRPLESLRLFVLACCCAEAVQLSRIATNRRRALLDIICRRSIPRIIRAPSDWPPSKPYGQPESPYIAAVALFRSGRQTT